MTSLAASAVTEPELDDTFHLIDPATGSTCAPCGPTDSAAPEALQLDQQSAVTPSEAPHESQRSTLAMLSWSIVSESWMQERRRTTGSSLPVSYTPPLALSSSTARYTGIESPSYCEGSHSLVAVLPGSGFVASEVGIPLAMSLQTCAGDENTALSSPFCTSPPRTLPDEAVCACQDRRSTTVSPLSEGDVCVQNSILRAQLLEADSKSAYYMYLHDKVSDELRNVYKTLGFLLHGDNGREGNISFLQQQQQQQQEQQDKEEEEEEEEEEESDVDLETEQSGRQSWVGSFLGLFGVEFLAQPPAFRHMRCRYSSGSVSRTGESMLGWRRKFYCAKWHARHARAEQAMENLLLAITSNEFDAWRSILVDDRKWNHLRGRERIQWDCVIAARVTQLLRKFSTPGVRAVGTQAFASCPEIEEDSELQEVHEQRTRSEPPLALHPDVLAPFIRRMSRRYMGEKMQYEEMRQRAQDTVAPPEEMRSRAPPHVVLEMELEALLDVSLALFPRSVALCYLLASIRAVQERREEASELLKKVMCMDPSYLLREGCTAQY